MLTSALILFAIAAAGGLILATMHITKGRAPVVLAVLHGAFAATGLILLIVAVVQAQLTGLPVIAIVLFAAAAIGGLILFVSHLISRPLPRAVIFAHGGAAVTAFILLLIYVLG